MSSVVEYNYCLFTNKPFVAHSSNSTYTNNAFISSASNLLNSLNDMVNGQLLVGLPIISGIEYFEWHSPNGGYPIHDHNLSSSCTMMNSNYLPNTNTNNRVAIILPPPTNEVFIAIRIAHLEERISNSPLEIALILQAQLDYLITSQTP